MAGKDLRDRIEQLLSDAIICWNEGNLQGFCEAYDENVWVTLPDGTHLKTREAAFQMYRSRYPMEEEGSMGNLTLTRKEVYTIDAARACVFVSYMAEVKGQQSKHVSMLVVEATEASTFITMDVTVF